MFYMKVAFIFLSMEDWWWLVSNTLKPAQVQLSALFQVFPKYMLAETLLIQKCALCAAGGRGLTGSSDAARHFL